MSLFSTNKQSFLRVIYQYLGPDSRGRVGLLALFTGVSVALTWPLILHLDSHVPLGHEPVATVQNHNMWILWWNADRLTHGYRGYWDAPIFAPEKGTFAFSETQFPTGVLATPPWLVTRNIALTYNIVLLIFLTLNGVAAYILMRGLKVEALPSLLTAVLIQALPYVSKELGVLQLTPLFGVLMTLHFARLFSEQQRLHDALGFGLSFAATYFITNYYGLMLSLLLVALTPILVHRKMLTIKSLTTLALGLAVSTALLVPFVLQQISFLEAQNLERSRIIIKKTSAEPSDYASLPTTTLGYRLWNSRVISNSVWHLYPGTGLLLLGVFGLITGYDRREWRRWVLFCYGGLVLAFMLSFGFNLDTKYIGLPPWQPYEAFYAHYPGLKQVRNLHRFGGFVQIFLALLAGLGLAKLHRRWSSRRWVVVVLVALMLIEVFPAPVRMTGVTTNPNVAWVNWLADQPSDTIVIHLPFPSGRYASDYEKTSEWMLFQMWHGKPMVNGYSGFFPKSYDLLKDEWLHFPQGIELMKKQGVDYILVDGEWLNSRGGLDDWLGDFRSCFEPVLETTVMTVLQPLESTACF